METSSMTEKRVCQTHGEYEAKLYTIGDRKLGGHCPICQAVSEKAEKEHQERVQADDKRRRIEQLFSRAGIPPRFAKRTFANYEAENEGQKRALRVSQSYADNWETAYELGTCLIFSGKPGTGKTHLACAIANSIMGKGYGALFTTVSEAMRAIKSTYAPNASTTEQKALYAFLEPSLMIFDEVGASKGSEHELQMMFDIMNKRYEHCRPTIILTNLDPVALREHLGDRVTDRLREGGGKLVTFDWESKRA